jgi:hypothetical protein
MFPDNDNHNGEHSDDQVGFGKPPKKTRFRKGQSGNPNGRPKGKRNWTITLRREYEKLVVINENGVRYKITRREALCTLAINKAMVGDPRLLKLVTEFARLEQSAEQHTSCKLSPNETVRKICGFYGLDADAVLGPSSDSEGIDQRPLESEDWPLKKK